MPLATRRVVDAVRGRRAPALAAPVPDGAVVRLCDLAGLSVEDRVRRTIPPARRRLAGFVDDLLTRAPDRFVGAASPIYGARGLSTDERNRLCVDNFAFLLGALHLDGLELLHDEGLILWSQPSERGLGVIDLRLSSRWANEGEQTMTFRLNGIPVFELAFMLCDAAMLAPEWPAAPILFVTRVQGAKDAAAAVADATRMLGGIHPAYALIAAAGGIVEAFGLARLVGIAAERQIAWRAPLAEGFHRNYDALFTAIGATRHARALFDLTLPLWAGPPAAASRAHRRRARIRRAIRQGIARDAAGAAAALLRSPGID